MHRLLVALPLLLAAGSALAQNRPPSPCERYIPTGEKLPRQDTSRTQMRILPVPNPTWRDRPVATAYPDEPVTIVQECGLKLRVRTVRGEEGWVPTAMLTNETKLYERSRKRPPATDAECEQRMLDPRLAESCKRELAAKREVANEAEGSAYLSAGELMGFVSGKTLVLHPRASDTTDDPKNPTKTYFAPDGEVFLTAGPPTGRMRWRGRWVLEGDAVCLPGSYTDCARLRKLADGKMVWAPNGYPLGYLIERSDGDSAGTIAIVRETYPNPKLPPAPKGTEDLALPSLGR